MLSELPKLADKAFILGFFLPTLLFVLAGAGICYDQPWAKTLLAAASQKDGWDSLAFFVLAVWVLAVLLMMVNQIELQILEGYTWPLSKIAFLRKGERERFERESKPFQQLNNEWKAEGDNFPEDKKRKWEKLRQELLRNFLSILAITCRRASATPFAHSKSIQNKSMAPTAFRSGFIFRRSCRRIFKPR